jgi:hypothetical protein
MTAKLSLVLVFVGLTSGCVNLVNIDARDNVEFGNFEASVPLGDDPTKRLRVRGSTANGNFVQTLDPDERIQVDETRIGGPADVDGEVDLAYYSIAFGSDRDPAGVLAGQTWQTYYLGVAQTEFDLRLENDRQVFVKSDGSTELYLQYGLRYAVSEDLLFGFDWAFSFGREFSGISEIDLLLDYRLVRQVYLSGGYRWFNYVYADEDEDSNLEVDFRGPSIGLRLAL